MKVKDMNNFNPEFPETYPWGRIDSLFGEKLAFEISWMIKGDLRNVPEDRNLTLGLRKALCLLAAQADVCEWAIEDDPHFTISDEEEANIEIAGCYISNEDGG